MHKDELYSTERPAWELGNGTHDNLLSGDAEAAVQETSLGLSRTDAMQWLQPELSLPEGNEKMSSDNVHTSSVPLSGLFYMR